MPCGIFSPYHMKKALTRTLCGTLCMANNAESGLPLVLYIYIYMYIGMNAHFSSLILKKVGRENVICYENLYYRTHHDISVVIIHVRFNTF